MEEIKGQTMSTANELTTVDPDQPALLIRAGAQSLDQNAAAVYLAGLAENSRRTMRVCLNEVAYLLGAPRRPRTISADRERERGEMMDDEKMTVEQVAEFLKMSADEVLEYWDLGELEGTASPSQRKKGEPIYFRRSWVEDFKRALKREQYRQTREQRDAEYKEQLASELSRLFPHISPDDEKEIQKRLQFWYDPRPVVRSHIRRRYGLHGKKIMSPEWAVLLAAIEYVRGAYTNDQGLLEKRIPQELRDFLVAPQIQKKLEQWGIPGYNQLPLLDSLWYE
jgi:hypothetical protein